MSPLVGEACPDHGRITDNDFKQLIFSGFDENIDNGTVETFVKVPSTTCLL